MSGVAEAELHHEITPRVELRKRYFAKTYTQSGVVEAELQEEIHHRAGLRKQNFTKNTYRAELWKQNFMKTYPLERNRGTLQRCFPRVASQGDKAL